jgi:hypothetical protein
MSKQLPKPEGEEADKYVGITEAMEIAESAGLPASRMTVISWVEKNDLGFQPGGTDSNWFVNKSKFVNFIARRGVSHGTPVSATP